MNSPFREWQLYQGGRKLPLWKTWNSPKPTAHFSLKWLTKPSKQVMISAPAHLTAAPPTPIFHAQGTCPQTTSSLSASEQSLTRAIHIPTFCVTVSFKTTFPTLQDPLSPGRSSHSLVSVMFTICPLSALMPLFPMTNFAASTYAGCTRNTRISNLRKRSRVSLFWVQVPPLVWLKCSVDDSAHFWE